MRYDVTEHPLLSGKALALKAGDQGEEKLQALVEIAESYLQLNIGDLYTGDQAILVEHFLALQVNWQIELMERGWEPMYVQSISSSHSAQSVTYRNFSIISPVVARGFWSLTRTWGFERTVRTLR